VADSVLASINKFKESEGVTRYADVKTGTITFYPVDIDRKQVTKNILTLQREDLKKLLSEPPIVRNAEFMKLCEALE